MRDTLDEKAGWVVVEKTGNRRAHAWKQGRAQAWRGGGEATQPNGLAGFEEDVQPQFCESHGADQHARAVIVDAGLGVDVGAQGLGQPVLAGYEADVARLPVQVRLIALVDDFLQKMRVGEDHGLFETGSETLQDLEHQIAARAGLGQGMPGRQVDPHRKGVDQQRGCTIGAEEEVEGGVNSASGGVKLLRVGDRIGVITTVTRTHHHRADGTEASTPAQPLKGHLGIK